jgi:hypothetical protein
MSIQPNIRPAEVMQALYDSEITVKTEPDGCWDNGFRAQIGDDDNGYEEPIIHAYTWDELMTKLAEHVVAIYPNSTFAQRYRSRAA